MRASTMAFLAALMLAVLSPSIPAVAAFETAKELGVAFDVPQFWNVQYDKNSVSIIHRGGDANCTIGLRFIAGVEVLSRDELDRMLVDGTSKAPLPELLALKYRTVDLLEKTETSISGEKAVSYLFRVDRRPPTTDLGLAVERLYNTNADSLPTKIQPAPLFRLRGASVIDNVGAYTIACTAPDADFDTADRVFVPFIRSIKLLHTLDPK